MMKPRFGERWRCVLLYATIAFAYRNNPFGKVAFSWFKSDLSLRCPCFSYIFHSFFQPLVLCNP